MLLLKHLSGRQSCWDEAVNSTPAGRRGSSLLVSVFDLNIYDCSLCHLSISLVVNNDVWLVVEVGYRGDLFSGIILVLDSIRPDHLSLFSLSSAATNLKTSSSSDAFKGIFQQTASVLMCSKASQRWERHACLCGKTCLSPPCRFTRSTGSSGGAAVASHLLLPDWMDARAGYNKPLPRSLLSKSRRSWRFGSLRLRQQRKLLLWPQNENTPWPSETG